MVGNPEASRRYFRIAGQSTGREHQMIAIPFELVLNQ